MRVFLSGLEDFTLAVPIEYVASIFIYNGNRDTGNEYISLPELFKSNELSVRHGLIIKNTNYVLLTAAVDSETDIPKKDIYPIPKTLSVLRHSRFISGIKISREKLIIIINPLMLIKNIHGEIND